MNHGSLCLQHIKTESQHLALYRRFYPPLPTPLSDSIVHSEWDVVKVQMSETVKSVISFITNDWQKQHTLTEPSEPGSSKLSRLIAAAPNWSYFFLVENMNGFISWPVCNYNWCDIYTLKTICTTEKTMQMTIIRKSLSTTRRAKPGCLDVTSGDSQNNNTRVASKVLRLARKTRKFGIGNCFYCFSKYSSWWSTHFSTPKEEPPKHVHNVLYFILFSLHIFITLRSLCTDLCCI